MTDTPLTPEPPPPPQSAASSIVPSNSTNMSLVGGALAGVFFAVLSHYGITVPAGYEAGIGALFAACLGYLPKSGRQNA